MLSEKAWWLIHTHKQKPFRYWLKSIKINSCSLFQRIICNCPCNVVVAVVIILIKLSTSNRVLSFLYLYVYIYFNNTFLIVHVWIWRNRQKWTSSNKHFLFAPEQNARWKVKLKSLEQCKKCPPVSSLEILIVWSRYNASN